MNAIYNEKEKKITKNQITNEYLQAEELDNQRISIGVYSKIWDGN